MNTLIKSITFVILGTAILVMAPQNAQGQFLKKLKKRVEAAVEETVTQKSEEKAARTTEQAFDSVFNRPPATETRQADYEYDENHHEEDYSGQEEYRGAPMADKSPAGGRAPGNSSDPVYRNFDFVRGSQVLFFDDFSQDRLGDFPVLWNTNGSGEVVNFGETAQWFQLASQSLYIPDAGALPENYTIEFDLQTADITQQTSSRAIVELRFEDHNTFKYPQRHAKVELPLCTYVSPGIWVRNRAKNEVEINNPIQQDIRPALQDITHISIAVHGKRLRLWVNEQKVVDIPRLVPEGASHFKIYPAGLKGKELVFITNLKIAKGGTDLRSQLRDNGKFSTTGILFESGSSQLKPQSYGVINEIAQLLQSNPSINLQIVGHTDSDGEESFNQRLSLQRAQSVMNVLSSEYNISGVRLTAEGRGESEPVDDNSIISGKANNRRVEFIQI